MQMQFVAVLENGATRSPFVPSVARYSLEVTLGADATIVLDVVDAAGVPVKLAGATVRLAVKQRTADASPTIAKTGVLKPATAPNRVEFTLAPADTKNLTPGRYLWDVWLTQSGKRDCIVQLSLFLLHPAIGLP